MKYAQVNGDKVEASKGVRGFCPICNSELIARCGDIKVHHWAHKGALNCDIWWENETEWHRTWKGHFPKEWQEVVHFDDSGEKHIADIKTSDDWVLEFQHSYLPTEERNSRNQFYRKLVWVVDGLRRKRDIIQFQKVLNESIRAPVENVNILQVNSPEESRLLKEWLDCGMPVFFDFQASNEDGSAPLWFLLPQFPKERAYLLPFSRKEFIQLHLNSGFDELAFTLIPNIKNMVIEYERNQSNRVFNRAFAKPRRKGPRRKF